MKKTIAGALLAGSLAAIGAGRGTGTAQADPFSPQPHSWCPGQGLPYRGIEWNMGVCHTWYIVPMGQGNVRFGGNHQRQLRFGRRSGAGLQPSATASAVTAAPAPLLHPARRLDHHPADLRRDRCALDVTGCGSGKPGDDDRVAVGRGLT